MRGRGARDAKDGRAGAGDLVRRCGRGGVHGGSAFGLAAADGVMRWCAEHDIGFATAARRVPIVTAAVLYDLGVGNPMASPRVQEGYLAAVRARRGVVAEGQWERGRGPRLQSCWGQTVR